MQIQIFQRTLHYRHQLQRAKDQIASRHSIVVQMSSGDYLAFGEACPLPQFAGENYADCLQQLHQAVQYIQQQHCSVAALDQAVAAIPYAYPCARFALSCAATDLAAQQSGKSLAQLLNPQAATQVQIQGLIDAASSSAFTGSTPTDSTLTASPAAYLKCKVGFLPLDKELQRLGAIHLQLNRHRPVKQPAKLRLDANGTWSLDQARAFCRALPTCLPDNAVDYLEDPCADYQDNCTLAEESAIPIAIDQAFAQAALRPHILAATQSPLSIFILKPMCMGTLEASRALAQQLMATNKRVIISDFLNGSIARTAGCHLAAAIDPQQSEWHGLSGISGISGVSAIPNKKTHAAGQSVFSNDFHPPLDRSNSNGQFFTIASTAGLGLGPLAADAG